MLGGIAVKSIDSINANCKDKHVRWYHWLCKAEAILDESVRQRVDSQGLQKLCSNWLFLSIRIVFVWLVCGWSVTSVFMSYNWIQFDEFKWICFEVFWIRLALCLQGLALLVWCEVCIHLLIWSRFTKIGHNHTCRSLASGRVDALLSAICYKFLKGI